MIQANRSNFKASDRKTIKYIVIHYTANNGDTAKGNANYFANNSVGASAHYFVDENEVVQSVLEKNIAWHCGANKYLHPKCRNDNSIGVELCSRKNAQGEYYFKDATVANAITLTKELMKKYGITADRVVRHYDVTGKNCPAPFVESEKLWQNFKGKLEENTMFKDVTEADYAYKHIKKLKDYGIVNGDENGNFNPDKPITRRDVAVIVANALTVLGK